MKRLHTSRTKALNYIIRLVFDKVSRTPPLGKILDEFQLSFLIRNKGYRFTFKKTPLGWEVKEEK